MSAAFHEFRARYRAVRAKLYGDKPRLVVRDVIDLSPSGPKFIYVVPIGPTIPVFAEMVIPPTTKQRAREILREVSERHGVTEAEIIGEGRSARIVLARHEVCYRMRKETTWSLPRIGRFLGDRDHTSIINGIKRHEQRMARDGSR